MAKSTDVHAQMTGKRGVNLLLVQFLPFDVTTLKNILSKRLENRFLSKVETQRLHAPKETPLAVPYGSQHVGQCLLIPVEARPIRMLMEIYSTHNIR